mmetsp:Transcript_20739/g.30752  ORF Transcript_20739/g.30752 Transcript_20739/m.30752 type:complete len:90 (-) Transcript_20739:3-272(-)
MKSTLKTAGRICLGCHQLISYMKKMRSIIKSGYNLASEEGLEEMLFRFKTDLFGMPSDEMEAKDFFSKKPASGNKYVNENRSLVIVKLD